ncbi:VOC family protein [Mycolicibacterium sarraceniae]|uniref:Glyoxalase/fosfomycin resistance/dioxygenase domain-containing protein n=1 Tax=Mycolicibacterium sarraceniae TaxID=1534348 RepID=A0A7I7SSQ9_9MYCO|nr:hypothetical protein MSAR_29090 [Mycolicibacterium sarraceniae]
MPIATTAVDHLRLTVTDITASRRFYDNAFGWPVFAALPDDADDTTREQLAFLLRGGCAGTFGANRRFGREKGSGRRVFVCLDRPGRRRRVQEIARDAAPGGAHRDQ